MYNRTENSENVRIGEMVILPLSFTGSPRDMQQNFIDAMSLIQRFRRPENYITMTCNPNWRELKENINKNEEVIDRPDIVAKVFCNRGIFPRVWNGIGNQGPERVYFGK